MDQLAQHVYQLIQENRGISLDDLTVSAAVADTAALDREIKNLIETGYITFIWGGLYPNLRTIGLVPKGERQTALEIALTGLTIEEIKQVIQPYENDPLYYDPYPIEEANKAFFERRYGIEFDFEHFDYYLLCGFDNAGQEG
jgi:hypothetical protein